MKGPEKKKKKNATREKMKRGEWKDIYLGNVYLEACDNFWFLTWNSSMT